jgi:hypothetical protein
MHMPPLTAITTTHHHQGCWPLFSREKSAVLFAMIPPAAMTLMFLSLGLGMLRVRAALKKPLVYPSVCIMRVGVRRS